MAVTKGGKGFSDDCNFKNVVSKCYYVDKTIFIRELIDEYPKHPAMLFTRPRRFGKSLNISMIRTFFEKTEEDTSLYFKDLDIWKCEEKYTSEQGKYPIISLDFKDVLDKSWDKMYSGIRSCIASEYSRFDFVESKLKSDKAKIFRDIKNRKADESDFANSLKFLCESLFTYYGVKPIILIDEYDVPIQKAYEKGYYDEVVGFIRSLFSAAFKGTDLKITFAVITGAMRIAQESIFTGLNNLAVYSVLTDKYSQYFGFTKDEVRKILDDFGAPKKWDEVCEWYDGYKFGDTEIFNPWSLSHYIDNNFAPEAYWAGTSSNSIIKDMLHVTTAEISSEIMNIVQGRETVVPINEKVPYAGLKENPMNVFSILL
ncbi:MAG: AAA family ATPase, partial [Clostridia bacterium]|nr:AAA family ATPase [Clostridia bacterium]